MGEVAGASFMVGHLRTWLHWVPAVFGLGCAALLGGCASTTELRPFATDGCSFFPDRNPGQGTDWRCCCVSHDVAYWRGGTAEQRLAADTDLKACVARSTGDASLAWTMYRGVRVGGSPYLPSSFRWNYGWGYGRFYQALSAPESLMADQLLRDAIAKPVDACLSTPADAASALTR